MESQEDPVVKKQTPKSKTIKLYNYESKAFSAKWDDAAHSLFVDLCVLEKRKGNRSGWGFNRLGWNFIISNFNKAMNRSYTSKQIRNHWTLMKKEWETWQEFNCDESGLCWDSENQFIVADDEWWAKKIEINKAFSKFRYRNCDIFRIKYAELFANASDENAYTPIEEFSPLLANIQNTATENKEYASNQEFSPLLANIQNSATENKAYASNQEFAPLLVSPIRSLEPPLDDYFKLDIESGNGVDGCESSNGLKRSLENRNSSHENQNIDSRKKKKNSQKSQLYNQIDSLVNNLSNRGDVRGQSHQPVSGPKECVRLLQELPGVKPGTTFWNEACILFMKKEARELFVAQTDASSRLSFIQALVSRSYSRNVQFNSSPDSSS